MAIRAAHRRVCADDSGASAVEFAIIVPALLLFLFGIFEFGRYFWTQNVLQFAAEQTARYAFVNEPVCDSPTMTTLLTDSSRLVSLAAASVTVTASIVTNTSALASISPAPQSCRVQARYSFSFLGYLDLGTLNAEGLAEYPCKNSTAKDDTCPTS